MGTQVTPDPAAEAAKATADAAAAKAVTDKAAADAAANVTYELKLPTDSVLDPTLIDRTTTAMRESKLSKEQGEKVFGLLTTEAQTAVKTALDSDQKSRLPGGTVWKEQNDAWKAQALADRELAGGDQKVLDKSQALAKQTLAKVMGTETAAVEKFLVDSGLASHPIVLKMLVRMGKAIGEDKVVLGQQTTVTTKSREEKMFPSSVEYDRKRRGAGV
jgi:hypothetical protein